MQKNYKDIGLTPSHVVNYFITRASHDNVTLTVTKLLKICFFGYAYYLAGRKEKIFPENVQAWQFGPVIPSIYYEYKDCVSIDTNHISKIYDIEGKSSAYAPFLDLNNSEQKRVAQYLEVAWIAHKKDSATKLVEKTHKEGTPWQVTYKHGVSATVIPDELIEEYYSKELMEELDKIPDAK